MTKITRAYDQKKKKACAFTLAGLFVLSATLDAKAGGPLGAQGSPITTNKYGVDLFQGPVLATSRIMGLGGAYTAIAEGTDGIPFNPAAASLRPPYSTNHDDYDLTAGLTLPSSVNGTDFYNAGHNTQLDNFYWLTVGGMLQTGKIGFGVIGSFQNYELGTVSSKAPLPGTNEIVAGLIARIVRIDPVISYAFADEQLHIGAGLRFAGLYGVGKSGAVGQKADQERLLINANTVGVQGGVLWAPRDLPLRVGGAVRSPVIPVSSDEGRTRPCVATADASKPDSPVCTAPAIEGDRVVGDQLFLPEKLELPYEVEVGAALQLGKRPLNIPWQDEDKVPEADSERWRRTVNGQQEPSWRGARRMLKARYRALPREKVLLSASVLLSGPVSNSVGIESMLTKRVDRSGQSVVVTVHGGAEAEIIPNWLVVRLGSYLEPTRYGAGKRLVCAKDPCETLEAGARLHATAGFSLRTIRWSVFGLLDDDTIFRVSTAVDFGARTTDLLDLTYFGWGLGAGLWL